MSSAADNVYKMLKFQYKPVEAHIKAHVTAAQWKMYKVLEPARKIMICDKWAAEFMGL